MSDNSSHDPSLPPGEATQNPLAAALDQCQDLIGRLTAIRDAQEQFSPGGVRLAVRTYARQLGELGRSVGALDIHYQWNQPPHFPFRPETVLTSAIDLEWRLRLWLGAQARAATPVGKEGRPAPAEPDETGNPGGPATPSVAADEVSQQPTPSPASRTAEVTPAGDDALSGPGEANIRPPDAPDRQEVTAPAPPSGDSWMGPADLAKTHKVPQAALEARLRRWRKKHPEHSGRGWAEFPDRGTRQAQYVYKAKSVQDIIDDLRAKDERRAKK